MLDAPHRKDGIRWMISRHVPGYAVDGHRYRPAYIRRRMHFPRGSYSPKVCVVPTAVPRVPRPRRMPSTSSLLAYSRASTLVSPLLHRPPARPPARRRLSISGADRSPVPSDTRGTDRGPRNTGLTPCVLTDRFYGNFNRASTGRARRQSARIAGATAMSRCGRDDGRTGERNRSIKRAT